MASPVIDWQNAFVTVSSDVLASVIAFLPNLLASLIVFLLGLILAGWLRALVVKLLGAVQLSTLVQKTGFNQFLEKAEVKLKLEEILGGVVKWLVILIFSVTAINILGLSTVSAVLQTVLGYIPRVFSAVLVLTVGVLVAGLVESVVKGALGQIDIKASRLLGKISSWLVGIFATLAAINELGIAQSLINTLFIGFVAMLALGFGLAIGLGAKDTVAEVLDEWYQTFKKEVKK
ncbi:hypothetical protein A2160_00185 [Candidatus Beckwithbacteria bacterium RBG_13_42_9]|uniref:Small-conductance mechanosensitive ion channel n=1 Tax=Candidatus Beckwithbacteria bacterium RBG_13_42_9 TaxID=1797457 RepID=A0A1F5E584_9BACT|nr:MAG: hypothetical protein A2160_00185 [Candidatus Beckwithbacteria bacterium RBG_13_42_9]